MTQAVESSKIITSHRQHVRRLDLSLKEHGICFIVPVGAKIDAHTLDLPGGILVLGALRGKVFCSKGSAIIASAGEFQGELDAENVYVEGAITSSKAIPGGISKVIARGSQETKPDGSVVTLGGLAAFGVDAKVHAHIIARAFHVPRQAVFTNSFFESI